MVVPGPKFDIQTVFVKKYMFSACLIVIMLSLACVKLIDTLVSSFLDTLWEVLTKVT